MDKDLKDKTVAELEQLILAMEEKKFHARTIFAFIHTHGIGDIEELTTLSKAFRGKLKEQGFYISNLKTVEVFLDPDGTEKYLFELADKTRVEAVGLVDESDRRTLCISTQVGCKMGCRFCATAHLKFQRHLTAGEIADQVIQIEKRSSQRIGNVVYMGMGEPFDNYDNVIRSVRILNDPAGKNIGARHITISTSGIVPGIKQLADESMQVRLAISLHGPNDNIRQKIMFVAKKYPLVDLMAAVKEYQQKSARRVTFEYVMIKGLNDSELDARALAKLIGPYNCNVNLIEYNPHPLCDFAPSDRLTIDKFQQVLQGCRIETLVRFKRGSSIKAACGQLGATWYKDQETQS